MLKIKINLWETCKSAGKMFMFLFLLCHKKNLRVANFVGHKTLINVENESTHKKVTKINVYQNPLNWSHG